MATADVLMITYNRPLHTKLSLSSLLDNARSKNINLYIWQNGEDKATCNVVREYSENSSIVQVYWSKDNVKLREPTNWFFANSKSDFIGKVDDDCLLPSNWIDELINAHRAVGNAGILGCWQFQEEDFDKRLASKKILLYGAVSILRNAWIGGSGYLMPRSLQNELGVIRDGESFTSYCIRANALGYVNGWVYPFIRQVHMDDPRATKSLIKNNDDFLKYFPLSAQNSGVRSVEDWDIQLRQSARIVQEAPYSAIYYTRFMKRFRRVLNPIRRALGMRKYKW